MRFLITGVAGFIGGRTAELLLEEGHEVVGVDELNDYYDVSIKRENLTLLAKHGERFRFHHKDICDTEYLRGVCTEYPPDVVVHLAARAGVRPSVEQPQLYVHSNVRGTVSMLELCREFKVQKLVMASSSSVYGYRDDRQPFREDGDADHPVSPYAATKRATELLCHSYHHLFGITIAALRFFTVYGPRGRPDMAPYKVCVCMCVYVCVCVCACVCVCVWIFV
jgi:UDP-glucuronate 4-epimerase